MAKPELGTKRQCLSCGARFYDLNKDPVVCPKCSTPFQVTVLRGHSGNNTAVADDEEAERDLGAVEIVSLDDVAADEEGSAGASDGDDIEIDDEIPADDDEEVFLADDDEENDDVSDLIDGDINSEDES